MMFALVAVSMGHGGNHQATSLYFDLSMFTHGWRTLGVQIFLYTTELVAAAVKRVV